MSRRKQARPIRHLDDEEGGGGGGGPDGVASALDGQEDDIEASTIQTGAGKFTSSSFPFSNCVISIGSALIVWEMRVLACLLFFKHFYCLG